MNKYGEFLVVGTEGLELKESLGDLDEEVVIVVHLFNDFDDVGYELIPDSVVSKDSGNDGYFGSSIEFETGIIAFEFLNVDCAVFLLAIV